MHEEWGYLQITRHQSRMFFKIIDHEMTAILFSLLRFQQYHTFQSNIAPRTIPVLFIAPMWLSLLLRLILTSLPWFLQLKHQLQTLLLRKNTKRFKQ